MTRCPQHWRGKHQWVGPNGMTPPTGRDGYDGMTPGCLAMLYCERCGESYASAKLDIVRRADEAA